MNKPDLTTADLLSRVTTHARAIARAELGAAMVPLDEEGGMDPAAVADLAVTALERMGVSTEEDDYEDLVTAWADAYYETIERAPAARTCSGCHKLERDCDAALAAAERTPAGSDAWACIARRNTSRRAAEFSGADRDAFLDDPASAC